MQYFAKNAQPVCASVICSKMTLVLSAANIRHSFDVTRSEFWAGSDRGEEEEARKSYNTEVLWLLR